MPKTTSSLGFMCLLLGLLLSSLLLSTEAARPMPSTTQVEEEVEFDKSSSGESCDGVGEEECLMRRTLVAHVDYIYTQGGTKRP